MMSCKWSQVDPNITYIDTRPSQKFGNILVSWGKIWQLQLILPMCLRRLLAWYSPSATCQICLYKLEHGFGIHAFRTT